MTSKNTIHLELKIPESPFIGIIFHLV